MSLFVNGVEVGYLVNLVDRGQVHRVDFDLGSDILAPFPPTVTSPSHTAGEWSNDDTVDLSWSGAQDGQSGLAGYSVSNDTSADTQPEAVVDITHTTDPHELTIGPLAESAGHYFHLSTCDRVRNCTGAQHLGPFQIDVTAPPAPFNVASPSHDSGDATADPTIDVTWTPPGDNLSGIAGYGWFFSRRTSETCREVVRGTQPSAASAVLADGSWNFHVCAVDEAGNWSQVASAGPWEIETPPRVERVATVKATEDGILAEGERVRDPLSQFSIVFSEPLADPTGDDQAIDATNPSSYLLVGTGTDGSIETTDCAAGPAATDIQIPLGPVTWVGTRTATLPVDLPPAMALPAGSYRLMACASGLEDLTGQPLDGDGDQAGGDDFVREMAVVYDDLLLDPNVDQGVGSWLLAGDAGAELAASDADVDAAASSGSAEIAATAASGVWMALQCVAVDADTSYELDGWIEIVSGSSAAPTASLYVEFSDTADCAAAGTGPSEVALLVGDTAGSFLRPAAVNLDSGSALSALIALSVAAEASTTFEVRFDSISFHESFLFRDGFESGDVSAWSNAVGVP